MNIFFKQKLIYLVVLSAIIFSFRYLPHPPNFTPVIALVSYCTFFFGVITLPITILAFAISDLLIGFHKYLLFTWGSLIVIGLISPYLKNYFYRFFGCILAAFLFFLISNFGVWLLTNMYANDIDGLIKCYYLAIPFFGNTLISTIIFSQIFELFVLLRKNNYLLKIINYFYT